MNGELCRPSRPQNKIYRKRKRDEYLDLAREQKKLWHMKVTVIRTVIGTLRTTFKELVKELEDLEIRGQVKTIQTIALSNRPEY